MNSPIEEIKSRIDIVDFLKQYITLIPAGKNFKAVCPFHKEKTPSFMVSPERQTWHCFGACNEGGDVFQFLMKHDHLEFYEALRILAEKTGIELRKISPAEQKQFGVLYDICEESKNYFVKELQNNKEAMDYALSRGLKKETIEEFEIGFAPNLPEGLTMELINKKFDVKDIERAGITCKSERGRYFDRFRGRLMFPITNFYGKPVGFSGRILPQFDTGNFGKYINSPETPIFNKSRVLYGINKSKSIIRQENEAVLVEGQMDFLMSYQDGIKNVVATSGTALTIDHLQMLRRLSERIVLCFDNDEAGKNAIKRGIDLAVSEDFNVRVLLVPEGKDPADLVVARPGELKGLINKAMPAMEFYFLENLGELINNDNKKIAHPADFKKAIKTTMQEIAKLPSPIERAIWIKSLAEKIKLPERALSEELEQIRGPQKKKINFDTQEEKIHALKRIEIISERLLSLAVYDKKYLEKLSEYIEFLPEPAQRAYKVEIGEEEATDERLKEIMGLISLRSSLEVSILGEDKLDSEFQELLKELKCEFYRAKRTDIKLRLKQAESQKNEELLATLLKEFDEVSKLIENK